MKKCSSLRKPIENRRYHSCNCLKLVSGRRSMKTWSLLQNRCSNLLVCRNCENPIIQLNTIQYRDLFHVKVYVRIYVQIPFSIFVIDQNICQNIRPRVCQLYVKCFVRLPIHLSDFVCFRMNVMFYVSAFLAECFCFDCDHTEQSMFMVGGASEIQF